MKIVILFLLAFMPTAHAIAQTLPPLKSLSVGNMWIYRYYINTPPPGVSGDAIETVVAKRMINGKEYAEVHNSYTRSFRYERSDSNTVYVWNGTRDTISHTLSWKAGDTVKFRSLWHGCDTCRYTVFST